jgi:hypothetical protein
MYILTRIISYSLIETKISALEQDDLDLELRANVEDVPKRLEAGEFKICRHLPPRFLISFFLAHSKYSSICPTIFTYLHAIVNTLLLELRQDPRKELLRKCQPMQQGCPLIVPELPPLPRSED